MTGRVGVVYLIHIEPRFKHAGHYTGWALDLDKRVGQHLNGHAKSSPLLRAALAAGSTLTVAHTQPGDRSLERRLKNQGGAARRCPICREEA